MSLFKLSLNFLIIFPKVSKKIADILKTVRGSSGQMRDPPLR